MAKSVSLKALKKVKPTDPDSAGKDWQSIKHGDLMKEVYRQALLADWKILVEGSWTAMSDDTADLVHTSPIVFDDGLTSPKGWQFMLGIATSNARRRALTWYYGLMNEDIRIPFGVLRTERHTFGLSLEVAVMDAMTAFRQCCESIKIDMKLLDEYLVFYAEPLFEACRNDRFKRFLWSKLGLVDALVVDDNERTKMSLLTAVASVAKTCPPIRQLDIVLNMKQILVG